MKGIRNSIAFILGFCMYGLMIFECISFQLTIVRSAKWFSTFNIGDEISNAQQRSEQVEIKTVSWAGSKRSLVPGITGSKNTNALRVQSSLPQGEA